MIMIKKKGRKILLIIKIIIIIKKTQETLDTLRSLHRELELEDAAEEPEEQVLSSLDQSCYHDQIRCVVIPFTGSLWQ